MAASQSSSVDGSSWPFLTDSLVSIAVAVAFVAADAFDIAGVERRMRVVFDRELDGFGFRLTDDLPRQPQPEVDARRAPAQVTMWPSWTIRSSPTGVTPNGFSIGTHIQCDVARLPSSNPAAARITEPEHTDAVHVAVFVRPAQPVRAPFRRGRVPWW